MPSRRLTLPAVAALALACIALGVLAALADGRGTPASGVKPAGTAPAPVPVPAPAGGDKPPSVTRATKPAPASGFKPLLVAGDGAGHFLRSPLFTACGVLRMTSPAGTRTPKPEPVPDDLLHAFGILRRPAAPGDAPPERALLALRDRGLEPFDPAAARLVRTSAGGGRAWVVPARDIPDAAACGVSALLVPPAVGYKPSVATPLPVLPRAVAGTRGKLPPAKPHPGLALVAVGDAPYGAGGRYEDLIRGREDVEVAPCSGPGHDMLGVSGLVPDGVPAAFLTSPDGTAIRADVTDNAYNFIVPMPTRSESRHVVWTGGDGTPHVQPLAPTAYPVPLRCAAIRRVTSRIPSVSPSPFPPFLPTPIAIERLPTPKRHK